MLVLTSLGAWLLLRSGPGDPRVEQEQPAEGAGAAAAEQTPPGGPAQAVATAIDAAARSVTAPAPPAPAAGQGDAGADELPHPHPITPNHLRIQRENNLVGALNGAMDVNDGDAVRKLLDQYREEYPDDPNQLQEGYQVIADCLQHPGPAAKSAAQRYFDQERGSILRRFVARHCLEP